MNEAETRAEYIDPALAAAGWGLVEGSQIRREYPITLGRLEGHGRRAMPMKADDALVYRNTKLAVVEAKARDAEVTKGVGPGQTVCGKTGGAVRVFDQRAGIYGINMQDGTEGEIDRFPTPEELWNRTFPTPNVWRDRFAKVPFEDKGGYFQPRYYQDIAIQRVLAAIGLGRDRVLLTLATGTGKTAIAFQTSWKLFYSRWNLGDWNSQNEPTRRPRILFLADRNILADQAFNTFSPFPEDAVVRIDPNIIRMNASGNRPRCASVADNGRACARKIPVPSVARRRASVRSERR